MTKTKTIENLIDSVMSEEFSQEAIQNSVKSQINAAVSAKMGPIVAAIFQIDMRWGTPEILDHEKFAATDIGKFMLGDVQAEVIKLLKKVDPQAIAKMIEKAVEREVADALDYVVAESVSEFVKTKLRERIDTYVTKTFDEKVEEAIAAYTKPKTKAAPKSKKKSGLFIQDSASDDDKEDT